MGTLRLGVPGADGKPHWLDELPDVDATFRPGYTEYELRGPAGAGRPRVDRGPALDFHGMVCRVQFDRPTPLVWQYGGIWWQSPGSQRQPRRDCKAIAARITEPNLPNGLVLAGWDGQGEGRC